MGYEAMCIATVDAPDLLADVFEAVGSRTVRYFERCVNHPAVGAVFSTDDWGFKTQPMLAPGMIRELVFPWHQRIVEVAHAAGIPAILHSCGNLETLMDGVIDELGYDGKHSWEDAILPVEQAWQRYAGRVAVVGGIDIDFLCRATPAEVYERSKAMIETTGCAGYILGSGNSIPAYVPAENYLAMVRAGTDGR
jgi:uroporphyrinogen decarboxylase